MTVQSGHKAAVISDKVWKMVEKGAIQEVKGRTTDVFFHQTVSGSQEGRSVLNLKPLNKFIYNRHFKMEGMHIVRDLL